MDIPATTAAVLALVWTGFQEVRMWKMCANCPYYSYAHEDEEKTV